MNKIDINVKNKTTVHLRITVIPKNSKYCRCRLFLTFSLCKALVFRSKTALVGKGECIILMNGFLEEICTSFIYKGATVSDDTLHKLILQISKARWHVFDNDGDLLSEFLSFNESNCIF
jgi:hypothetical protein